MRQTVAMLLCLLLAVPLVGCSEKKLPEQKAEAAERIDSRLAAANTDFAFRLFARLRQPTGDSNTFFSPASVAFALGMVYNGAAGETMAEMAQVMGIEALTLAELNKANADLYTILQNPDAKVETTITNSLWPDDDALIKADFIQRNQDYYAAEVQRLDYAQAGAHKIINGWVEKQTKGKIKELFDDLQPDTRLVLVNTLYFNGEWTEAFEMEITQKAPFTLNNGTQKLVPLMYKKADLECLAADTFTAVRLPYGKERLSMYIFVPQKDLTDFYQQLNADSWHKWLNLFTEKEVTVYLPRFKAEYKAHLNNALQGMGMQQAFDPGQADFSAMADEGLFISDVVHQAYIDVHEKGTEAAAATGVVVRGTSLSKDFLIVRADRPFFFAIRDDLTGTILFMGEITNP